MEGKEKNITAALKKISTNIETGRKNIEADSNLVENLNMVRGSFGEIESVIKGQLPALDTMKKFTKQVASESSKNLQVKRFFQGYCQRARVEFRQYLQVVRENFVVSLKSKSADSWGKMQKQFQKLLTSLKDQSQTGEKIYLAINKINAAKDLFLSQFFKLMLYRKNVLWRDLNAPYDDYIHGEIKSSINLIKSNEERYGYIPNTLQFSMPKFDVEQLQSSLPELLRIIMVDYRELIEGLKNYSKLSGQPQIIEDISKNQHIVKGLRERIQLLTVNYESLMEKYRALQISKGKSVTGPTEEKSLSEKLEELQGLLMKKEQQIIELKQIGLKQDALMSNQKQRNKELEDELSKWHKYQIPKIKEMEINQRSLLDEFAKVKRDLQTYSGLVQSQREEKIKTLQELKVQRKRVLEMANILGRERRRIKQLKMQINRQEKIVMQLVDKIPEKGD